MLCKKCGNTTLPRATPQGNGVTSRPCPICGDQNYQFPPIMMKTTSPNRMCEDCNEEAVDTENGKYCFGCRARRRKYAKLSSLQMEREKS